MASFFQSLHRNGIYHAWQESRRKSNTGWILLSVGIVLLFLSFVLVRFSLYLILGSGLAFLLSILFIFTGTLEWRKTVQVFEPTNDNSLINLINQKVQSLPVVAVYESENPSKAVAIFTPTHSYILPFNQKDENNDEINSIKEKFAEQMERILPSPWQHPTVLEPVRNSMEIEAAVYRITEESANSAITMTMLETIFQFAKVIQSFVIIGRPLPQLSASVNIKQDHSPNNSSSRKLIKKNTTSFGFDIRRHKGFIYLLFLLGIGFGVYYLSDRTGPTAETTYRDEFKMWVAERLPLEYHSYIGLGTLQDNIETSITAVTLHSTPIYDKVGGGQVLTRLPESNEVNVIQEELVSRTYWYYANKDNVTGWVKNNDLVFKHLLPAKTATYRLPGGKETFFSPERSIPFAIKQKYVINGEEWYGIVGFTPINDVVWIRKGDYK